MNRTTALLVAGALLVALVGEASAQMGPDRDYYVSVSGGRQTGTTDLSDQRTFTIYDEPGTIIVNGTVGSLSFFDLAVGRRITGGWTVGLGFHRGTKDGSSVVVMGVPHPLFFGRGRDRSEAVGGLAREEHATHLQIGYLWDLTDELQLHVVGGPSFFRVKQISVTDVQFSEVGPPFDQINIAVNVTTRSKNVTGGHVGADLTYRFYETDRFAMGAGGFVRWTGASAELTFLDSAITSNAGGFQYGVGLRFGF
jgi:hypothetical protein